MVLLNKIGEIVMEQLQKDRNYTGFLCRLIEQEMKAGKFRNKNELIAFINKINGDLATVELSDYIRGNGLSFNPQEFNMNVNRLLEEYDRINLVQNTIQPIQQPIQQPAQQAQPLSQQPNNKFVNQQSSYVQPITEQQEKYVPLTKIDFNSVSQALIEKVNFMIVNPNINTNDYMVDLVSGNFKNIKDNSIYAVNKNAVSGTLELVLKDSVNKQPQPTVTNNMVSNNNIQNNSVQNNSNNGLSMVSDIELQNMVGNPNISDVNRKAIMEEIARRKQNINQGVAQMTNVSEKDKPKTKVKAKNDIKSIVPEINNSAFASTVLLTVMSAIFGIVIATVLLAS